MTTTLPKKASQKTSDWHPADIKAALHKAGITLSMIALEHGLNSSTSLSAAMVRSSPAGEERIAAALGRHPMEIWPSRYNKDGTRKPQGFRALQFNAGAVSRNVKELAAA